LALEKSSKDNIANDIENRLDDFFDEDSPSSSSDAPIDDLKKLKSVVLSIDWEITDTCLTDLMQETERLLPGFEEDRYTHALLRMLNALGRYIQKRKASAHPVAINRVMTVYTTLEKLASDATVSDEERRQMIANEIVAFKKLKQQVESQRTGANSAQSAAGQSDHFIDQRKFEEAMGDVEKRLTGQVADLKAQIENLQKEIDALRNS
jgi:hypothetical protein